MEYIRTLIVSFEYCEKKYLIGLGVLLLAVV